MPKGLEHYKQKLSTLRSGLDKVLEEMDRETAPEPPRLRRNLKDERALQFNPGGRWSKPAHLKKTRTRKTA